MKRKLRQKVISAILMANLLAPQLAMKVNASAKKKLKDTKLYTGTKALFEDLTPLLLVIETLLVVALCIIEGIKAQGADSQERTSHIKNIKIIIGIGIFIVSATALLPVIMGYYS